VTGDQVEAVRGARRWANSHFRADALENALAKLIGADVHVRVRRIHSRGDARVFGEGFGVLFAGAAGMATAAPVLVQAEVAVVTTILSRLIRRPQPNVVRTNGATPAAVAGAFAAVLAAASRRAQATTALRVAAAGGAAQLEGDLLRVEPNLVAIACTVLIADEAYSARVLFPRRLAEFAPSPVWDKDALTRLGATPLSIPVVATAVRLSAADVASLHVGDVVIPPIWPLSRAPDGRWVGPVLLSAPDADEGVRAQFGEGGGLMLRGEIEPLVVSEEEMSESDANRALVRAVGDLPLIIRVEIGEFRMRAKDWASLDRGDMISLGQRLGERVTLRAGGIVIARGDLVEIDGEVGVRLVERVLEETAKP